MLRRSALARARRGYTLHRRRLVPDALGELTAVYDMEHPDVSVLPDDPHAVRWHSLGQLRSWGRRKSGLSREERGERCQELLQGALFSTLPLSLCDRVVLDGVVYEVLEIQRWPGHRMVYLERV